MAKSKTYDASSISVLEGLEAVRKRPGMYIGSVSRKGLNHLIYEIVDNAVDEHLAGYCSQIDVYLEEEDGLVVADYKTDSVTHAQELVNRYQVQLDYYALALEQMTGRRVKEKIIYSFALAEEVVLGAAGGPYLK